VLVLVVGLDAMTKTWARSRLLGSPITVIPSFFTLAYVQNTGIAFGLFQGHGRVFAILSPLAFLLLGVFLGWHVWCAARLPTAIACGMITGGASGNVWSRLIDGYVIDFLDFYVGSYHWPAFNVADTSLCCGVALFLLCSRSSDRGAEVTAEEQAELPD
jgi:signal peptidase II